MFRGIVPVFCLCLILAPFGALAQDAQDASELVVRLSEMEQRVRQMTGEIERLQFENRQLKEQLRVLGASQGNAAPPPAPVAPAAPVSGGANPPVAPDAPAAPPTHPEHAAPRRDVFDPERQPGAPGVPRQLGTTTPSQPLTDAERKEERNAVAPRPPGATGPSVAATGSGDPRADYDEAYTRFSEGNHHEAEMGFRKFLQSHPRDARVPEAMYWLGETYLATDRPREAGEQFLAISKNYGSSPKAPSAMLKLGVSLTDLGASDRACAIFAEVARKYPKASQSYKDEVAKEQRRAKCP